ncbi:MAG: RHS repeat-associated core domain-containing protein, partial [Clostridia bacterium]|nr:RHS repeat-associated core domain-containing protein [Clostridia bacterium]
KDGASVVEYKYDAWGNHKVSGRKASTIGNINPFRYRSYFYDTETGLYFLQTRYYDPEVGRFLNMDSVSYADPEATNGLNLYVYCANNPVMNMDPSGHFALTISAILSIVGLSAGIGALFGLGSAVVKDLGNGKLFDGDVSFRTYLGSTLGGAIAGAGIGVAVALGAGVGVAVAAGETLTIGSFAISGIGAFAISAGASAVSGGLGYVVRTAISDQEEFNWNDMFIETGMNALSGITSFIGGYVGGVTGLKIPGHKLGIKKFLLFHGTSLLVGVYAFKAAWALAKYALKKEF